MDTFLNINQRILDRALYIFRLCYQEQNALTGPIAGCGLYNRPASQSGRINYAAQQCFFKGSKSNKNTCFFIIL